MKILRLYHEFQRNKSTQEQKHQKLDARQHRRPSKWKQLQLNIVVITIESQFVARLHISNSIAFDINADFKWVVNHVLINWMLLTDIWHLFLVPAMMPITSAGLPMSSASTVITTSSGNMMTMSHNTNYPQLTPISSINNHEYQQMNQSPTCFQSNFPHVLDLIKMENNAAPHIVHTNLARALNGDNEKNNNKVLDLELKQHRQSMLTNIESR